MCGLITQGHGDSEFYVTRYYVEYNNGDACGTLVATSTATHWCSTPCLSPSPQLASEPAPWTGTAGLASVLRHGRWALISNPKVSLAHSHE